ncbi:MAG: ABC transporter substrate-binding protein [Gaiellaceae bacterium]
MSGASVMREERKVVTVLFADLVGSTSVAERLDPEETKLVVGEAVARMVGEIERVGGHVKDLAGDGVLAFFGAPVSYEDDAERAVRAGLRIVEEIGAYGAEVARGFNVPPLEARIGITTGPVVLGAVGAGARVEYGAFGDVVNVAARLEAAAEPGTILVDSASRRLVEPLFHWSEPRTLGLKGKRESVTAYVVEATRAAAGGVRGSEALQVALVGRDDEVATLRDSADALRGSAGGVLFVTGEAGIGKSRLIAELRALLGDSATWLEGRCVSYGDTLPYWPFRDLLREWLGVGPDDPEVRVRVALRRESDRLFGSRSAETYPYLAALLGLTLEAEAAGRIAQLSPEALQYRTFEVVRALVEALASTGPLVLFLDDLHWADPTSVQLTETLLDVVEASAVLLVIALRPERDHGSWRLKELAQREYAHATRELALEPLGGDTERELLNALVGDATLPPELESRLLEAAEGNPFYLEELVRSLVDAGAIVDGIGGRRYDHDVAFEVPATVEKVVLARLDRLTPAHHDVLTAASALGRRFGLPLLEGVLGETQEVQTALHELQRLDLLRAGRRWPQPEYRFKHALIQETAYRTLLAEPRAALHRRAATWLESQEDGEEVLGLLAHHWLAAADEEKAISYLERAADKARQEYALDEAIGHYRELLPLLEQRGARQEIALALFKLALALHTSMRFAEANATYQRAFEHWQRPAAAVTTGATIRMSSSVLPNDPDPKSAIAWPNIQLCMQLFDRLVEAWPERTIVPSLAERWEIDDDGLRYVFHLRDGLRWSDGTPLTAHDVEFGVKRVLDPESPGASVAIYFVLENGQDYALGRNPDADRIGVRALDDRTLEFRLVAPAPYFLSVMNRPDGGPQPRQAIEAHGARWTEPELQVVSGPFRQVERTDDTLTLERRPEHEGATAGNAARVEIIAEPLLEALERFGDGERDIVTVRYTPKLADLASASDDRAVYGATAWTGYLAFDHEHPLVGDVDVRRALAYALDRDALASALPPNLVLATGGVVPPALQGHTPDIALRFDPGRARKLLEGRTLKLAIAGTAQAQRLADVVAESWRTTLGAEVELRLWDVAAAARIKRPWDAAPIVLTGWLPGYADPEYFLRLLFHSESRTNEGGFAHTPFDELIEQARQERSDRARLELFHAADRLAVADRVAVIPLVYGRSMAFLQPSISGWWEFGKTSAPFADLRVSDAR